MNETVRTFIAVPIPDSAKGQITEFQKRLIRTHADVKWVKPESIHITLKFLGDVEKERIHEISKIVQGVSESFSRFTVHIAGTGVFPNDRRPKVLWIGVREGAETLIQMAGLVDSALSPIGFEKEKRPFSPHLTVGRVRSFKNIEDVVSILQKSEFDAGFFEAEKIVVMKSDLRPTGAVHTPLATIKLRG